MNERSEESWRAIGAHPQREGLETGRSRFI
jgi:hypothetical protein